VLRKLAAAAIVAAACTVNVPAAHAGVVRSACQADTTDVDTAIGSGDTYTGYAYGYAVFDDQATHTLRCYVTVDGTEVDSTGTGTGVGVVVAQSQVTYVAAEYSWVELCTEIDGVTVNCGLVSQSQIPPQEFLDAIDAIVGTVNDSKPNLVDPILCPVLASLAPGIPGVVDINAEGDTVITAFARVTYDCPPYGDLAP
jgi:hypothetical protein